MSLELLRKLQKLALFFLILFLPLNSIPKRFAIPGIGGDLSNYFFILGMVLLAYEYFRFGFSINKKVRYFFCTYIVWQLICLAHGLYFYEYNELLTLNQIPRLEAILNKIADYGMVIQELTAIKCWLFLRFSKNILLLNNIVFLLCFYIWNLYKDDFTSAFNDVRRAVICLVILMGAYSFVELLWLKLNHQIAKDILVSINPYLYDPVSSHGWWPPLLWKNQLRSITHEPSFFGILSVMCLPVMWSMLWEEQYKKFGLFITFYFTFMIAATNARTAVVVTMGELLLLMVSCALIKTRVYTKRVIVIMVVFVLAFSANLINFKSIVNSESVVVIRSAEQYLKSNVTSVANTTSRSNNARFGNLVANLNTIVEYPIMGIGTGLKDIYIDRNLPEFAKDNAEIKLWSRCMREKGVLKSGYPALNKYADIAVQNGLVGLLLYLSVPSCLIVHLIRRYKYVLTDYRAVMLVIAMSGLLATQLSNSAFVICNGIIWGLLFCKLEEIDSLNT